MVDGSGSIEPDDWEKEQTFAKDAVAAFARRNVFENGGSASYVQFSSFPLDMGTFYSEEMFDAHVDSLNQYGGGTDIVNGKLPYTSAEISRNRNIFLRALRSPPPVSIIWLIGSILSCNSCERMKS